MWARLRFFWFLLCLPAQRRYAWRWLASQQPHYLLTKPCPWITFAAIDFLRGSLRTGLTIFEYGSGGSTLFWLRFRPTALVSVEHDPAWHAQLTRRLDSAWPADYRLVPPEIPSSPLLSTDPADPDLYTSADAIWSHHTFQRYVTQIDSFPAEHFDVVLVDGRARAACLRHGAPKVKVGGWLILDNSDRSYYLERTAPDLKNFEPRVFVGAIPQSPILSETTIFVRQS
jgi:hypothetical protein